MVIISQMQVLWPLAVFRCQVSVSWLKAEGSRLKGWEARRLEALEPSSFPSSQSYRFLAHQPLSLQL
jgi:hypothetical protein